MLIKFVNHCSLSFQKIPKRIFSDSSSSLLDLKNLFAKARLQLKNSNELALAINNFKSGVSLSAQLYPDDNLEQSYWHSNAAFQLAEKKYLKESEEFLQQAILLLDQIIQKTESLTMLKVYFSLAETYKLHKNLNKSEEFYMKSFDIVDLVQPDLKLNILEQLIQTKMNLKKFQEVPSLSQYAFTLFESSSEDNEKIIRIFTYCVRSLIHLNQLEKASKMVNRVIQLISTKPSDQLSNTFIIHAYNLLVDAYMKNDNEDEALEVVLEGGKLIEKYFDDLISIYFYRKMCEAFEFKKFSEPVIRAIVELSEKNLSDYSELTQVYKETSQFYLSIENHEKSLEFSNKALGVARKWNNPIMILDCYIQLAEIHLKIDPDNAKGYLELGETLLDSYPNKEYQRSLEYLYYQYFAINLDYENASSRLAACISCIPETFENNSILINLHIEHGTLHNINLRIEKSLKSFYKALGYTDKYYSKSNKARLEILSKIGNIHANNGELEKGLEYLTEALELEENNDNMDLTLLIIIKTSIMECYSKMNQMNLALDTGNGVIELIKGKEIEESEYLGGFYFVFGQVYQKMINKDKAKWYYVKARNIFTKLDIDDYAEIIEKQMRDCDSDSR